MLTAEQTALVEAWLPLAEQIAQARAAKYRPGFELGDVQQWAALGLIDAAIHYDGDRADAHWEAYATMRIRGAIVDGFRRESTIRRTWDHRRNEAIYRNPYFEDINERDGFDHQFPDQGWGFGKANMFGGPDPALERYENQAEAHAVCEQVAADLERVTPDGFTNLGTVVRLLASGMTAVAVAAEVGVHETRISQIKRVLRPLFRFYLEAG